MGCVSTQLQKGSLWAQVFAVSYDLLRNVLVSLYGQGSLGMIVVLALLMHKAPESIGYGTFLWSNNCPQNEVVKNLIVST